MEGQPFEPPTDEELHSFRMRLRPSLGHVEKDDDGNVTSITLYDGPGGPGDPAREPRRPIPGAGSGAVELELPENPK
jgi:hypothetical protein